MVGGFYKVNVDSVLAPVLIMWPLYKNALRTPQPTSARLDLHLKEPLKKAAV